MWGIIISAFYALILWIKSEIPDRIFMRSTKLLFYWYITITCIFIAIVLLICMFGGVIAGAGANGMFGFLLGGLAGSGIGVLIGALIVLFSLFEIVGAHLLRTTVTEEDGKFQWSRARLVFGIILIIISLLLTCGGGASLLSCSMRIG